MADRSFYTWHVTFEGQTALHELVTSQSLKPARAATPANRLHASPNSSWSPSAQ